MDTRYFSGGPIRANDFEISGLNGNITLCFVRVVNINYFYVESIRIVMELVANDTF